VMFFYIPPIMHTHAQSFSVWDINGVSAIVEWRLITSNVLLALSHVRLSPIAVSFPLYP